MPTHTIELSDHDDTWLRNAVESGQYSNISAAIQDALGLLEADLEMNDEEKLERLRKMAREGFEDAEGPDAIVLNTEEEFEAYMSAKLQRIGSRGNTENGSAKTAA